MERQSKGKKRIAMEKNCASLPRDEKDRHGEATKRKGGDVLFYEKAESGQER